MSSSGQTADGFRSRPVPSRSGSSSGQGPTGRCPGRSDRASDRVVTPRAGIVVTGTEVLTGRVRDRNGPWLSDRLFELGVELAHITICGDRPQDIEAQLRFMADQGVDLIVTSGGLGPTADDMTVEVVARFRGLELMLDEALEDRIAEILRPLMRRFRYWDPDAMRAANRKQALVPEGAVVIDPVGTAPGLVVPGKPVVVVLPGPPRELQPMWDVAVDTDAVRSAIAGRTRYTQHTLRLFGLPESALAETLREAETGVDGFDRLEITTCLRGGELEMVTRAEPGDAAAYEALAAFVGERHPEELYSTDGARVDDLVAALLDGRRVATAESCTAGLIAGPGGGSEEKPVGTVCWSVRLAGGASLTRTALLPGGRSDIRERATTVAMHLLRRVLSGVEAG